MLRRGDKGDYLKVLGVTLRLLKWPEKKIEALPSLHDEVELVPKLKGKVIKADANAVYVEVMTDAPVLLVFPLWGLVTWS